MPLFSYLAASAAVSQSWAGANDRVRVAVVGVGSRGTAHTREMLPSGKIEVAAVVDPDGRRAEEAAGLVFKASGKSPKSNPTCAGSSTIRQSTR